MCAALAECQWLEITVELKQSAGDGHTFAIQVSADRSRSWQTVAVGLAEPSVSVDWTQFRSGQVRVIVTNGFASSVGHQRPSPIVA